jgi:hypothetical protein
MVGSLADATENARCRLSGPAYRIACPNHREDLTWAGENRAGQMKTSKENQRACPQILSSKNKALSKKQGEKLDWWFYVV